MRGTTRDGRPATRRGSRVKDKVGETYGLIEVLGLDRANDLGERQAKWRCRCHCGCGREDVVVRTGDLGRCTRSCGSLRSRRPDNKVIEHDGRRMIQSAWAREAGIDPRTLAWRLNAGWPMEKAIRLVDPANKRPPRRPRLR